MDSRYSAQRAVVSIATLLLAALGDAGCAVGPRYHRPQVAIPQAFAEANADTFDATRPPASTLWHAFNDPVLDHLIEGAISHNKTLAVAIAQLNEARALRGLEAFALLPTVTAAGNRTTSRPSKLDPFVPASVGKTTTFKAGFDASWEIDLFGAARNARRAVRANEAAASAGLEAAQRAIIAEVAQTYFSFRSEQERLRVAQRNVANLEESQKLLEARQEAGRGSELDTARARSLLYATEARLPQTESALVRDEQRLAVLTAQPIDALRTVLGPAHPLPILPALVAIGDPQQWFRRRPDVQQAEQRLIAATAEVGVSAADFFPQLTLLGGFGWTSQAARDIGTSTARRWNYGPSLTWSFLDVGRVRQRVLAAKARAVGAVANYEDTVLRALEDTENAFAGYRAANRSVVMLGQAADSARSAATLAQARFDAGAADTLVVLDAERTQLDLEDQYATAASQRTTALAALYKALAGDFATGA